MNTLLIFLLSLLSINGSQPSEEASETNLQKTTTYYFIRHAEKADSNDGDADPDLSEEGERRADNWAQVFRDLPLDAVYSTDYKRTRNTAGPVASSQALTLKLYDPRNLSASEFLQEQPGGQVLVVGHSNTTPAMVNGLLGDKRFVNLKEDEYGKLFIVRMTPGEKPEVQLLHINSF